MLINGMNIFEIYQLSIAFLTVGISAITDLKFGKIKNLVLGIALAGAFPIQLYSLTLVEGEWILYLTNFVCTSIIAVLLYINSIWAAGDCKLVMLLSLIMPLNAYWKTELWFFPSLSLIILFIAITYVFIVFDSLIRSFLNINNLLRAYKRNIRREKILSFMKIWTFIVLIANLAMLLNTQYFGFPRTFIAVTVFFIIMAVRSKLAVILNFWPGALALDLAMWYWQKYSIQHIILMIVFVGLLYLIGETIRSFNYRTIAAEQVEPDMILATSTIQELTQDDKHIFLRKKADESINSKLSKEEAFFIRQLKDINVSVVRKLPFAVFMAIALGLYILRGWYYAI